LQLFELRDHKIERFVPRCALEHAVTFYEWMKQAVGVMNLQVSGYAFGAQTAFIDGKIVPWLEADDMIVFDKKIHAALHPAVWAVCRHNFVYHTVRTPTAVRRVVQMWTVGFDYLFEMLDFAHASIFRLVAALNPRPLKYPCLLLRQRGIRQPTYDSLAARTVILPNASITHLVVKAEFFYDCF
jgi:hypothetical protein